MSNAIDPSPNRCSSRDRHADTPRRPRESLGSAGLGASAAEQGRDHHDGDDQRREAEPQHAVRAVQQARQVLAGTDPADLVDLAVWLGGGVLLHDAVLAPLVVLLALLVLPRLPAWGRAPAVAGFMVLGSVTLLAIPAIGRFGAREDVPSLLNRPYGVLWLGFAALVVAVVVVAALLRRRRTEAG